MVVGIEEGKGFSLNPAPNMMESPVCDEGLYFDGWKQPGSTLDNKLPTTSSSPWEDRENKPLISSSHMYHNSFDWPRTMESSVFKYPGMDTFAHADSTQSAWKNKHPEQWSSDDVTLWLCSLMTLPGGCPLGINVTAFHGISGSELGRMTCAEFQNRDPQNGMYIYMAFENVKGQMSLTCDRTPTTSAPSYIKLEPAFPSDVLSRPPNNPFRYPGMEQDTKVDFVSQKLNSLDIQMISFDVEDKFDSIRSLTDKDKLQFFRNLDSLKMPRAASDNHNAPLRWNPETYVNTQTNNVSPPLTSPSSEGSQSPPYCGNDLHLTTRDELKNPCYGFGEVKGNHLWEFIRDLLFDSRYNPSLVKWEDREEGVFKFVKSDQVAKLWGRKKNNPAMTYEKLSRAMRYYYRRKILERIDGRRLVYKFGSMATGWQV